MMELNRPATIAVMARRFRLLADRPELLYPDPAERAERALAADLPPLDTLLAGGANDTECVCAQAVALLRDRYVPAPWDEHPEEDEIEQDERAREQAILDELSVLPPDYLVGVYFALPERRRAVATEHPVWANHIKEFELEPKDKGARYIGGTLDRLAFDLAEPIENSVDWREERTRDFTDEECEDMKHFRDGVLRRTLGLEHDLTPEEQAMADAADAVVADALGG